MKAKHVHAPIAGEEYVDEEGTTRVRWHCEGRDRPDGSECQAEWSMPQGESPVVGS